MNLTTRFWSNSNLELACYFSRQGEPVSDDEFWDFWFSLTLEEMKYFRSVSLVD